MAKRRMSAISSLFPLPSGAESRATSSTHPSRELRMVASRSYSETEMKPLYSHHCSERKSTLGDNIESNLRTRALSDDDERFALRIQERQKDDCGTLKTVLEAAIDFVWEFMETSSIHGFNHLTARGRAPLEYVFWIVMMLIALWGAISIGLTTWRRYEENPIVLSLDRDSHNFDTPGPSATFCPTLKMDEEKLQKIFKENGDPEFKTFITALFNASYFSFGAFNAVNKSYEEFLKPSEYQKFVFENSFPFHYEVVRDGGMSAEMWRGLYEMGLCYSYNTRTGPFMAPEVWSGKVSPIWELPVLTGNELSGDMYLQLHEMNSPSRVYLGDAEEVVDSASGSLLLRHKTFLAVEVRALATVTAAAARALAVRQRRCRLPHEVDAASLGARYSYGLCRMECRMRYALRLCGCVPFFYRQLPGNYEICGLQGMRCLAKYEERLVRLIDGVKDKIDCGCLAVCDSVTYFTELKSEINWFFSSNFKYTITNFPKMRIVREVLFGFTDVLVSIGGTAGLFLGCSLLSIIEIVYFFTLRLFWHVYHFRKRKTCQLMHRNTVQYSTSEII